MINSPYLRLTFKSLSDTPPNYAGNAGKYAKVDSGEIELEFDTPTGAGVGAAASACSVYLSGDQSVARAGWVKIEFDTELFDIDSEYDKDTNYRFTPTREGYYQVNFLASITMTDGNALGGAIYKNGSSVATEWRAKSAAIEPHPVDCGKTIYLNGSTDYIEFFVYHDASVNRNVESDQYYSYATIMLMGAV